MKNKILFTLLFIGLLSFVVYYSINSHASKCNDLKSSIITKIEDSRACSLDSDCISYTANCAFGCDAVVNASQIEALGKATYEYAKMCHHFCPPCEMKVGKVACVAGSCRST